jgi:hypothetical protein
VKEEHTYSKKMARNGRTMVIYEGHSFRIRVYPMPEMVHCTDNLVDLVTSIKEYTLLVLIDFCPVYSEFSALSFVY